MPYIVATDDYANVTKCVKKIPNSQIFKTNGGQFLPFACHTSESYVLQVQLRYFGTFSVHPVRNQIFAYAVMLS